jgi:hypothetical protein
VIPSHVLSNLSPDERVAILSRGGEIHFLVHPAADEPAAVLARARQQGCDLLATHMQDPAAIRNFVASRERDIGGEG